MKDKRNALRRLVCVVAFVITCAILLLPYDTGVDLRVKYDQKMPGQFSRIYYDTGNGITKEYSIKKTLKTKNPVYHLPQEISKVESLRFDPVEKQISEPIILHELEIYGKDGLVASYQEEELGEVLLPKQDLEILTCDANGYVLLITGEDAQMDVSQVVTDDIRRAAGRNYFLRGYPVLVLLVSLFCYLEWERIKRYGRKVKHPVLQLAILLAVSAGVFRYVFVTYAKSFGFKGQMFVILSLWLLVQAIGIYQKGKSVHIISVEKAISFLLLCQAICGSNLFGIRYEAFKTDILFYLIYIGLQAGFFFYFWIASRKSRRYILFVISIWIFRFSICVWGYGWTPEESLLHTADYLGKVPGMLSFIGVSALVAVLWGILGQGIASVIYALCWLIIFTGNMIEMVYHATFVKAIDVLVLADLKAIISSYVSVGVGIGILIGLVLLVIGCYYYREQLLLFMRPKKNAAAVVFGAMILILTMTALSENVYSECFEIRNDNTWSEETVVEKKQGFYAFTFINLRRFLSLIPDEPENYSEQIIAEELEPYTTPEKENIIENNEKPDVIYIMLESVMDPDLLTENYGVQYSQDPDPTLDQYRLTTTLAATFGGFTAKSEFEALTGMCDIFLMPGTVPYSTYFSNQSDKTYSLVDVFSRNGYETTAIHQNNRTFYNRAAAYGSFGFDQFIAQGDYEESEQDYNEDHFMKCSHLLPLIEEQLESSKQPQFIWAVTIEGHSPYTNKYAQTDMEVTCDMLNESQISELEQYMQSVKNTDDMVKELIAYIEQRERPTLLVVFGDHLPRLEAFDVWGTAANPDLYYATSCAAYANYKDVTMDEDYLSMNYLPGFVLQQVGIENESFYNYLNHLQKEIPVIRSWRMPEDGMERLKMYDMMQYDMLFGKQYFHP